MLGGVGAGQGGEEVQRFGRRKGGGAEAEPPASPLPPIVGAQRRVNRGVEGHAELQERGPLGSGGPRGGHGVTPTRESLPKALIRDRCRVETLGPE